jgi:hypothetical protein
MAQPFPPQGNQSPHTERPLKVYAEQYLVAGGPLPVGATTEGHNPMYADGRPHVITATRVYELAVGDWVISNRYTGQPVEVISAEEFAERFGPGGAPVLEGEPT